MQCSLAVLIKPYSDQHQISPHVIVYITKKEGNENEGDGHQTEEIDLIR